MTQLQKSHRVSSPRYVCCKSQGGGVLFYFGCTESLLRCAGFSSCGTRAQLQHMGSQFLNQRSNPGPCVGSAEFQGNPNSVCLFLIRYSLKKFFLIIYFCLGWIFDALCMGLHQLQRVGLVFRMVCGLLLFRSTDFRHTVVSSSSRQALGMQAQQQGQDQGQSLPSSGALAQQLWFMGLVATWHVISSQARD